VARQDNTGQRPSETSNTAYWRLMVRGSTSDEIWFSAYDPDTTGVTSFVAPFLTAVEDAYELGRTLRVGAGIYHQDADIDVSDYPGLKIVFDPGVTIRNSSRLVLKNDDVTTFYLAWSLAFTDCPGLQLLGWPTIKVENTTTQSSNDCFDAGTYLTRRPVLFLDGCDNAIVEVRHQGNAGPGISGTDKAAIIAALSLTPTPVEHALFALRGAFFLAYRSDNVIHRECELVPDTCRREQFTFLDSHNCRSIRPKSRSAGNNFASMGKSIHCNNFQLIDPQVTDTGTGSLWDIIGDDGLITGGTLLEYPNGKVADFSHEWSAANRAASRLTVRDLKSTGIGVVNVQGGTTTSEQVSDNPMTGVFIDNCQWNIGREDWSENVSPTMARILEYDYVNHTFINESPVGTSFTFDGGRRVSIANSTLTWTLPAASLNVGNRSMVSKTLVEYIDCDIRANSSLAGDGEGLAVLAFSGMNVGGRHVFRGGSIKDTTISIGAGAQLVLYGVELEDFDYIITDGTISFIGCTRDGVPMDDLTIPAIALFYRYPTQPLRNAAISMDAFLRDLSDIGAIPFIEAINIAVTDAEDQAFLDLFGTAGTLNGFGNVTWTRNGGVNGDGSTTSVRGLNFASLTKFVRDSAYAAVWAGGAGGAYPNFLYGGTGASNTWIITRDGSDRAIVSINDANGLICTGITDSRGFYSACRTGASARTARKNGVIIGTDTEASVAPVSTEERMGRRNTAYSAQPYLLRILGSKELGALDADIYASARRLFVARGAVT
jgi:hypothetical protein